MNSANRSQLPLAISLSGLTRSVSPADRSRAQIHWAADLGFRAVALDGAAPDTRARELDRGARRDLAALLRRRELTSAGVELWIPPDHLLKNESVDRAMSALTDAVGLAAELALLTAGAPVLHTVLPEEISFDAVESIRSAAVRDGVQIAVYSWDWRSRFAANEGLAAGFDPRMMLEAGIDLAMAAGELSGRIAGARLTIGPDGEIAPGIDARAAGASLAAGGYTGYVSLDLKYVSRTRSIAESIRDEWRSAHIPGAAPGV